MPKGMKYGAGKSTSSNSSTPAVLPPLGGSKEANTLNNDGKAVSLKPYKGNPY